MSASTFYTYRLIRLASHELWNVYSTYVDNGEHAAAQVAEIEYHLTRGHELFHARKYHAALTEYQTALALTYKLLRPTFNPNTVHGLDIEIAVRAELFEPLLSTAFLIADRTPDTLPPTIVNPPVPVTPFIDERLQRYDGLGLATVSAAAINIPEVETAIRLGDQYHAAGQFDEAIPHYSQALGALTGSEHVALRAAVQHNLGVARAQTGQFAEALTQLDAARQTYEQAGESVAAGHVAENMASVYTQAGRYRDARSSLDTAEQYYAKHAGKPGDREIRRVEVAAASVDRAAVPPAATATTHELTNAAVRLEQHRNQLRGLESRQSFIGRVLNRFRRSIETPTVEPPQLQVQPILGGSGLATLETHEVIQPHGDGDRVLRVVAGLEADTQAARVLEFSLSDPNRTEAAVHGIYEARVAATTLDQLGIYTGGYYLPDTFTLNLPHHYLFTLQMALGDTYKALGQYETALSHYEKARDYQYLNKALEAPTVWVQIAECLNDWGYALYAENELNEALARFRQVVDVSVAGELSIPADSPLFEQAPFADIEAAVTAFLPTINDDSPAALEPEIEIEIRRARSYQQMIHAGLNVLGLPFNLIPIFRFRYLQAVARYFAEQAIKAEREYVSFMSNSERETVALNELQQAVDLADAMIRLEDQRVAEVGAQMNVAQQSKDYADLRRANAVERRNLYATVSADTVALDRATAHASGGFTETEGGYQVHLQTSGQTVNLGDEDYEIMRSAAWHRGMIMRQFELDNMQRTIDEYDAYGDVADAQVVLAQARLGVAVENQKIARLRKTQAVANLNYAMDKTFNAALWYNLAERMRQFSQVYMQRGIEIAFIMQAAYNFEMDANLDVVRNVYATGDNLNALLGADTLLADINYFTYHHITQTKTKEIPIKRIISLAERYPFAMHQFRRTGVVNFETKLEDFDRMYPGTYMRKITAVEVYVEGLIGADGVSGSLQNTGVSVFRTSNNDEKLRLQPRETAILSGYNLKQDIAVFRPSQETLGLFEASGVATAWTIAFPRDSNDLDYEAVSDIKLVLYFTAYHDPILEETVRAALPTTGQWSRAFSMRFNYPDAFFLFLDETTATVEIAGRDFPFNQENPEISRLAVYVLTDDRQSPEGIHLLVANANGGHEASVVTGADGTVTSDPDTAANPLNVFHDDSPIDGWTVTLNAEANPELLHEQPEGSGVFRVRGIRDIVLAVDYRYDVTGASA